MDCGEPPQLGGGGGGGWGGGGRGGVEDDEEGGDGFGFGSVFVFRLELSECVDSVRFASCLAEEVNAVDVLPEAVGGLAVVLAG